MAAIDKHISTASLYGVSPLKGGFVQVDCLMSVLSVLFYFPPNDAEEEGMARMKIVIT
jgi:hypothetical protein